MGALRRIAAIVRLHFTQLLHDRGELFSALALPILLTTLLGFMYGGATDVGKPRVLVVDLDRSTISRTVVESFRGQQAFRVTTTSSRQAAVEGIRESKFSAAVVVPMGFGRRVLSGDRAAIDVLEGADKTLTLAVRQVAGGAATRLAADQSSVRVALEQLGKARDVFVARPVPTRGPSDTGGSGIAVRDLPASARASLAAAFPYLDAEPVPSELFGTADRFWTPPPVKVVSTALAASAVRGEATVAGGHDQSSLGVTVWFVLMLLLGSAVTLLEERENRTLPRLLTMPTSRAVVLLGKVTGMFLVGLLQAVVLIAFGALVFHVPWGSDPLAVAVVIVTYALACTGLAIAVAALAWTRSQASAIGPVLSVGLAMLGGTMWPVSIVPPAMQTVAKFTPTGQAMTALTDVVVRHRGLESAITPALILLAMAALFFAIGVSRFEYE